ncbi:MAG: alpha/beta hydrolase [Planctomycetes bacterium]|nr:alpha/beta hydrolase [Planctomycetota bacterium]
MLTAATGVLLFALVGLRALWRKPRKGWWKRVLLWTLISAPVHACVTMPCFFAGFATWFVHTRMDEAGYSGPRIAADGAWQFQSRDSLREERLGEVTVDPAVLAAARARAIALTSSDGVTLRAFVVPPRNGAPRATVILVHGLFRGALELEPVGAMFRELGCEVVLLELRNHGESGRTRASFGIREANDVLAAVEWARGRDADSRARPLLLFGVSLGTAAVAFAAPRIDELAGVVVDAPLTDAVATAHRMLGDGPRGTRRFTIPQPIRSLTLLALELVSGIDLAADRPGDALVTLAPAVHVLVIGGAADRRMPPDELQALFARLPQDEAHKSLWIRADADHGDVWNVDPDGYRERLARFVLRVTAH